jgi:hypothetical protein
MTTAKNYFQDRLILILLGLNAFLACLIILEVLLYLPGAATTSQRIVQYRPNLGQVNQYKLGSSSSLYNFIGFAGLVFMVHLALSMKAYPIRQQLAVVVISLSSLLLLLGALVGYFLLVR